MDATCKTCPFYGGWNAHSWFWECRHEPCGVRHDRNPESWWCSEHPLRQRDRLAAMFAAGSLADGWTPDRPEKWAARYYALADALIAEAARSPSPSTKEDDRG